MVAVGDGPLGVTNVVVEHHAVPFAACEVFVVVVGEALVFLHEFVDGEAVAHRGTVVDLCHSGTGYNGIIN